MRNPVAFVLTLLAGLSFLAVSPAVAQKAASTARPANGTSSSAMKAAVVQVDGITNRIIDNLWEYTDLYWHNGDYNRIIGLCRVLVEADPSFNDAYENAAYLLWSQGDTKAADEFLEYGLSRTKDKMSLLFEFGRHLITTKRYAEAEPYLRKASEMPTAGPVVFVQYAHSLEKQKKNDQALKVWQTVVKRFPNFPSGPPNLKRVEALQQGTGS